MERPSTPCRVTIRTTGRHRPAAAYWVPAPIPPPTAHAAGHYSAAAASSPPSISRSCLSRFSRSLASWMQASPASLMVGNHAAIGSTTSRNSCLGTFTLLICAWPMTLVARLLRSLNQRAVCCRRQSGLAIVATRLLAAVFERKPARLALGDGRIFFDDLKAVRVRLQFPCHRERNRPRGRFPGLVDGHPAQKRARNDPDVLGVVLQCALAVPRLDAI